MSIYLSFFYIRKPVGSPPYNFACLPAVGMSPKNEFTIDFFLTRVGFSVLDIKTLMSAANLTFGEVIWLLFELVLIVLMTRTDKTANYIEVVLYKTPF